MSRILVRLALAAAALPLLTLAPPAGAAPAEERPAPAAQRAPAIHESVPQIVREKPSETLRTKGCWRRISGLPASQTARVKVWIERLTVAGDWVHVGDSTTSTILSGCGSRKTTIHTIGCNRSVNLYSYRSRVDVDLVGRADSAEVAVSGVEKIRCFV
ncbi:hypothetical protein [Nocardioides lijunqiniae]|uniref:hypothetical protein n=1 Tax=Nocardioides lijunqiniae TaxID=2760832 RepID=UPI001878FBF3|nr:hypothetical protein [Nocardioides lijunqiniae]